MGEDDERYGWVGTRDGDWEYDRSTNRWTGRRRTWVGGAVLQVLDADEMNALWPRDDVAGGRDRGGGVMVDGWDVVRRSCFDAGGYLIVTESGYFCAPRDGWVELQAAMTARGITPAALLATMEGRDEFELQNTLLRDEDGSVDLDAYDGQ